MAEFVRSHWKLALAGVAAAVMAVLFLRRRSPSAVVSVAPASAPLDSTLTGASDSGLSAALNQQANMIAAVSQQVADANAKTQEAMANLTATTTTGTASTNAVGSVVAALKRPNFGPELGFTSLASIDPALQSELDKRAKSPAYKQSEAERTRTVIQNRTALGMDVTDQLRYYQQVTGDVYQ